MANTKLQNIADEMMHNTSSCYEEQSNIKAKEKKQHIMKKEKRPKSEKARRSLQHQMIPSTCTASCSVDPCVMKITKEPEKTPRRTKNHQCCDQNPRQRNEENCFSGAACNSKFSQHIGTMFIPGITGRARCLNDAVALPTVIEHNRFPKQGRNQAASTGTSMQADEALTCARVLRDMVHGIKSDNMNTAQKETRERMVLRLEKFLEVPISVKMTSYYSDNSIANLKDTWNEYRQGCDTMSMSSNERQASLHKQLSNIRLLLEETRSVGSHATLTSRRTFNSSESNSNEVTRPKESHRRRQALPKMLVEGSIAA